jgi:hypothetical protein
LINHLDVFQRSLDPLSGLAISLYAKLLDLGGHLTLLFDL